MKKIFLLFFVFFSTFLFSQDKQKIDYEFADKNKKSSNSSYFNLFLSSKNCYKCISEVHSIFSFIEKNKIDLEINLITDNIVLARKETEEYPFKINYFVDKKIFEMYPQSFYYYKKNGSIIEGFNEILTKFKNDNTKNTVNSELVKFKEIKIQDSKFSDGDIFISGILKDKIIVYDRVLNLGGVITSKTNSLDYYDIAYSSEKMYNLPAIQIRNNELISYKELMQINKNKPARSIKLSVISIYDDVVYAQFEVSQTFKDLEVPNKLNIYSFSYIAVKEMGDNDDISTIFDLDTYDSYLYTSDLSFNGEVYRLGVSNYYPFIEKINKYTFVSHIYNGSNYEGEATLELKTDFSDLKIIDIKPKENAIYSISPYLKINNDHYFINKKLKDELSSDGIISFIKGV